MEKLSLPAAATRVAIRTEGEWVNAYVADPKTKRDSLLLGSIRRDVCESDNKLFEHFKNLMRESMSSAARHAHTS